MRLYFQISPYGDETAQRSKGDADRGLKRGKRPKIILKILPDINALSEIIQIRSDVDQNRRENQHRYQRSDQTVQNPLNHKRPLNKPIARSDQPHNRNFFFGGKNGEPDGVERYQHRDENERQADHAADFAAGANDVSQLVYHRLILPEINAVNQIFIFSVLQKQTDGFVLGRLPGFNTKSGFKRIVSDFFQGLKQNGIAFMPFFELRQRLLGRNVINVFYFAQRHQLGLDAQNVFLLGVLFEINADVNFILKTVQKGIGNHVPQQKTADHEQIQNHNRDRRG